MPNISETSVSVISLSPACSVMIIFFLGVVLRGTTVPLNHRGWSAGASKTRWSSRQSRRPFLSIDPGLHTALHLSFARADSAYVVEVARRFGMSSGQDVSVNGLKSRSGSGRSLIPEGPNLGKVAVRVRRGIRLVVTVQSIRLCRPAPTSTSHKATEAVYDSTHPAPTSERRGGFEDIGPPDWRDSSRP
jgi:hypothetical protein